MLPSWLPGFWLPRSNVRGLYRNMRAWGCSRPVAAWRASRLARLCELWSREIEASR
jgi:hypothetical protein